MLHGRFETRAIHAGQDVRSENGAVMTPVYFTSTFQQDAPAKPRSSGYEYSRTMNPTRTALQENLAALESARWGLAFASGLAATNALLDRLVPGDHVIAGNDLYGGTWRMFQRIFARYGIELHLSSTPPTSRAVERAIEREDALRYIETPSNPLLRLTDIEAVVRVAHAKKKLVVVDNTFATPYLQRPLELGADLVLHSLTKYLGGHSDVVAGALCGNDEKLRDELAFFQNAAGGQLGPMDAFLVLRGTKTLALRMERHSENALRAGEGPRRARARRARALPGLPNHPQYALGQPPDEAPRRNALLRAPAATSRPARPSQSRRASSRSRNPSAASNRSSRRPHHDAREHPPTCDACQASPTASCASRSASSTSTT